MLQKYIAGVNHYFVDEREIFITREKWNAIHIFYITLVNFCYHVIITVGVVNLS